MAPPSREVKRKKREKKKPSSQVPAHGVPIPSPNEPKPQTQVASPKHARSTTTKTKQYPLVNPNSLRKLIRPPLVDDNRGYRKVAAGPLSHLFEFRWRRRRRTVPPARAGTPRGAQPRAVDEVLVAGNTVLRDHDDAVFLRVFLRGRPGEVVAADL